MPVPVAGVAVELADETRPAARAVVRREDGSFELRSPRIELPAGARIEVAVGVRPAGVKQAGMPGSPWRFELGLVAATNAAARALASRTLDPARVTADSGWHSLAATVASQERFTAELVVTARSAGESTPIGEPVLGVPRVMARLADGSAARNVVLISLDTLRADRISAYGNPHPTTPTLDALAGAGVRFANAFAPATSTPPSHMSMLTGTLPCRHGIFGVHVEDRLPDGVATLAEILAADGFTTAAITENAYVGAPYGFARGFDSFRELKQPAPARAEKAGTNVTPTGLGPATFAAARAWLRDHRDERFFLFVHTYQMHGPREPRPPYSALFRDAAPRSGSDAPSSEAAAPPSRSEDPAFHDLVRYDQLLREADDLLRDLTATIAEIGARDDTILVVTSDHGEAFREHGDHGHGFSLWEEVTRVPLVLSAPGLARPGVVKDPAGLVDLVPTLLELLGLPVPPGLDGVSLAARVRGAAAPGDAGDRVLYMETAPGNAQAARDGRFKVMRFEDGRELAFDLAADPRERHPLGSARDPLVVARLERLRSELARRHDECRRRREQSAAERTGRTELDPARREKLRALGYVE